MPNLAGKPPLGLKEEKPQKQPKRGLRKISAKKAAQKRQEAFDGAREHMARVASLPCIVCGAWPVEVHHEGKPRSDWNVIPLCPRHHRREFGPGSRHYSPKQFFADHGSADQLLNRVADMLKCK